MESLNGTVSNLHSELHPQPLLPCDSLTSANQQPVTALFASDEQLIKEAAISSRWGKATPTSVEVLWADLAAPAIAPVISQTALLNTLLPKPRPTGLQFPAQISPTSIVSQGQKTALTQIKTFLNRDDSFEQLKLAFNIELDPLQTAAIVRESWKSLPEIEVVSSRILGRADGAFDAVNQKIYLASDLINRGQISEIVPVLIEEIGHYLDSQINPNRDSAGDEGAIFSNLVRGIDISPSEYIALITEDDRGIITIHDAVVIVEQAVNSPYTIKAEGTVSFNGSSDLDGNPLDLSDDALVYGGKGFTFNGNTILPVQYSSNGQPLYNNGKLVLVDRAVSVAAGYLQANVNGNAKNKYANLTPPQIVATQTIAVEAYADIKQHELMRRIPTGALTATVNISQTPLNTAADWALKFPTAGTATLPKVVTITGGGLNIPANINLSNYVIIVNSGDINFNGAGNLSNVTLVTNNGNINLNSVQSDRVSILASGTINHNSSAKFGGSSLLANGTGDITFNGATKGITATDNLWVISAGNLIFNGSQSTRGSFLSKGNFTANGSTQIYGTVASKQNIIFNGASTITYANIPDYSDKIVPVISAGLVRDTGVSNSDKITTDARISGTVTDASQISEFKAGFNTQPTANYTSVLSYLQNGSFSLTKAQLEQIYGSTIPDGSHTLNLIAKDLYGNQSSVYSFTFTLDTTIPTPTVNLALASDSGVVGDFRTSAVNVTLTGQTEANARVLLGGTSTPITADAQGKFSLTGVALNPGNNSFTVTATDLAGNQQTYTQTIYRTLPPTGVNLTTPQVLENSAIDTDIGQLKTSDPDGVDNYSYTLVDNAGGRFKLVGDKIGVLDGSLLDFETNQQHQIQVRSTDSEGDSYLQTITIGVVNVNENPTNLLVLPTIILENSPNRLIGQITTTDVDLGDIFGYSLVAGGGDTDNSKFTVAGNELIINNSPDFETQASYTVRLRTTDAGGLSYERPVIVTVTNVNEAPTNLVLSNNRLAENSGINGIVGIFSSTDPDLGDTKTYTLTNGLGDSDNAQFTIVGDKLQLNPNPNFEAKSSYQLRVKVTDAGGLSYSSAFTVNISDVNETPTNITIERANIDENILPHSIVGNLATTDPDNGDKFTYSLVNGIGAEDNSKFSLVGEQLLINQSPNFEAESNYTVRISSIDSGGLKIEKVLTIGVNNLNEAPIVLQLANQTIAENSPVDTLIGRLTTIDSDAGDSHTYTLSDDANGTFKLQDERLFLNQANLDFESKSSYNITVISTDRGGLTKSQVLTIAIDDVNETPTAINLTNSSLAENVSNGTVVGNLSASDPDNGDSQNFSLVTGDGDSDRSKFTIANHQLLINQSPNFEQQSSYSLRIRTTDAGGLTFDRQITISITDVNEAPIGLQLSSANINENSAIDTVIGTLSTSDVDGGDRHTYSLSNDAGGLFKVVGDRVLLNRAVLDFETKDSYTITVVSEDQGGLTYSQEMTIAIADINEAPTNLTLDHSTIAENTPPGVIGNLNTSDVDSGDNHTYNLVAGDGDGDNSAFTISNNQLKFLITPDFETKANYSLRLRTTDRDGLSVEKTFTINITNVNEAPTQLRLDNNQVAENGSIGTVIGKFTSTDVDLRDSHTYSLIPGNGSNDNDFFEIVNDELRLKISPDFETQSIYYLRVQTQDALGLTWEQELTVNITDVSENTAIVYTLAEGTNFNNRLERTITIPANGGKLSFKLTEVNFDSGDINGIKDALEIALVDAQGKSRVLPFQTDKNAFFNWTEGENIITGNTSTYDPTTRIVTIDLTGAIPGNATLIFHLINNDTDTNTNIKLTDISVSPTPPVSQSPSPPVPPSPTLPVSPNFFNQATDVSPSIVAEYHRTSFNTETQELFANIALKNQGNYGIEGILAVVIKNISDPSVRLLAPDGFTPEGLAYYTVKTNNGKLDPRDTAIERTLVFKNPNGVQFSYELMVLGEINTAPVIQSQPRLEVISGKQYQYQIQAQDVNGDSLSYQLLSAPTGMSIDASTGLVTWNSTGNVEIGNYQVSVEVSDGRGGLSQQDYNLSVVTAPPNRPPVFTSTPVVDANVNSTYTYQVKAEDIDGDNLTISLVNPPQGMVVDSEGKVTWTPTVDYLGLTVVTVKIADGRGGEALQEFKILTQPAVGNQAPIFTSAPVTLFNLAATINAARGNVNRQVIDLELPVGTVATQNISITLPNDGTSGADIVFVVDESGSMGDARAWIANMVLDLDNALQAAGITTNRYAFVGYGPAVIPANFTPEEAVSAYTVEGKAGDTISFDLQPNTVTGLTWTLLNANGQLLKSSAADFNITFPQDGKYLLFVQHPSTGTITYQYQIIKSGQNVVSTPNSLPLSFNNIISGNNVGQPQIYTFNGVAGQQIYYDGISTTNFSLKFTLTSPDRTKLLSALNLNSNNLITLKETGIYTLTVGDNTNSGGYSFQVLDGSRTLNLNEAAIVTQNLIGFQSIVYKFDGTKGQRLTFDSLNSVPGNWRVIGPSNQQLSLVGLNNYFSLTLSATGEYLLVLEPVNSNPVNYSFRVLLDPEVAVVESGFNILHSNLLPPLQQQVHTFTASAGTLVYLDNQDLTSGSIAIEIRDPNNTLVSTIYGTNDSAIINLPRSGKYTTIIKNTSTLVTNDYAFQMLELNQGIPISVGNVVAASLPGKNATQIYKFTGEAGQRIYFDTLLFNNVITAKLISPSGAVLINGTSLASDHRFIYLSEEGTYSLLIGATNAVSLDYKFRLIDYNNPIQLNSINQFPADRNSLFTTPEGIGKIVRGSLLSTGFEDGYEGIQTSLQQLPFRPESAGNIILITDEDRDILDAKFDFNNTLAALEQKGIRLNGVIGGNFVSSTNKAALGMSPNGTVYLADGSGGFSSAPGGKFVPGSDTTKQDYIDLIWADGGTAWSINQFRGTGTNQALNATSFTKAFVAANTTSIAKQLSVNLTATNTNGGFSNQTGIVTGVAGGQTATFNAQFTGTGQAQVYDLLFQRPDTGVVLGSVPVVVNGAYTYDAQAIDPDGDVLTYKLVNAPSSAKIDAQTGLIRWLPTQIGTYQFTVETSDGKGGTAQQVYQLAVKELPNTAPVITSTAPTNVVANTTLSYQVIATDTDANVLSYVVDTAPTGLTIDRKSGLLTWKPTSQQLGSHTVNVRVLDGRGGETTQQINLQVVADSTNRAPKFTSTSSIKVTAGESYQYAVKATDADGDALTYESKLLPSGMRFDTTTNTLVWQPGVAQIGSHKIVLKVEDGRDGFELQTFDINVTPANIAPVITSNPPNIAVASTSYQYQITASDSDGRVVEYRLDQAPVGMTISNEGIINWKPGVNQIGTQEIKLSVVDDGGLISTQTYNLEVLTTRPNSAPVITSTPRISTLIGTPYIYDITATDIDNNSLTYSLVNPPVGMTLKDGIISWIPNPNQFGIHQIEIQVSDGSLNTIQTYQLDVTDRLINNNPTITSTPTLVTSLDRPYTYQLTGNDIDGDSLIWSLDRAPTGMVIDSQTGILKWNPTTTQIGNHTIAVRVSDSFGAYTGQEYSLKVNGLNTAPQIKSSPVTTAGINSQYRYQVRAVDNEGDILTYSLGNSPSGMVINNSNGLINWTPNSTQLGNQSIEVLVTDSLGAVSKQSYDLVVGTTAINQVPSITSQPVVIANTASKYQYQVVANDPEGSNITYQLKTAPTGMVIDGNTGLITWTNPISGSHQIIVTATDTQGGGVAQGFTLNARTNNAPIITSTPKTQIIVGNTYRYDVIAKDLDGDVLSYALDNASKAKGITIDKLGRISWTPTNSNTGTQPITVTVTDTLGATVNQTYNLVVTEDNTAPSINLVRNTNISYIGETVAFQVQATDNVGVKSRQLLINNQAVILDSNNVGTFKVTSLGVINATAIVTDVNGNTSTANNSITIIDPNDKDAPTISLSLPTGDITNLTDIIGTVTDTNLDYYKLEVAPQSGSTFTEVFRGTNNVSGGVLGKFDPTVWGNDTYQVRLTAVDKNGASSSVTDEVTVAGDLKLGNFRLSFTDVSIPVTGIPINLTRTYDTLTSTTKDDFGYGWRMEFRDTDLRTSLKRDLTYEQLEIRTVGFQDGDRVFITLPGGKREGFTFKAKPLDSSYARVLGRVYAPSFVPDKGVTSKLSVPGAEYIDNTATNKFATGSSGQGNNILIYNALGDLVNLAGRVYRPEDDGFGNRYLLTSKDGTKYEINATSGDLETVSDTNGNVLTFSDSEIKSSTGVSVTFERDNQGRITSVTDPLGAKVKYGYDTSGDLISVTDRDGNTTGFEYDDVRSHYLDKIVDPLGREAVKQAYDELGRLKQTANSSGNGVEFVYDPNNSIEIVKDALGNPITYEYDNRGNIVTQIDAVRKVTKHNYDDDNNMLSETVISDRSGAAGFTTTYTYDGQQNKLSETDALGNTTYYTYGEKGRLLTTTDALGRTTTNAYDSQGNLTSSKDAIGNVTTFDYDSKGQLTQTTDAQGNTTLIQYDVNGHITKMFAPLGYSSNYTYNSRGDKLTETKLVTTASGLQTSTTTWLYNSAGQIMSMTDALGHTTAYEYDKLDKQIATTDALGRKTQYRYDENGKLIETIYADDTSSDLTDNPRTKTEYDSQGRVIETIDKTGRSTRTVYDFMGRVIETIYADSTPNNLTDNPRTKTEYYSDGKIKARIDQRENRTEYRYDAVGRQTEIIYADNTPNDLTDNPRTQYQYNQAGQQVSVTDALNHTTRYQYDNLGRAVKIICADDTFTSTVYDALGRQISSNDQNGQVTEYRYDAVGKLTGVKNALGDWTNYAYTQEGSLFSVTDANSHSTSYEYDLLGRRVATIMPLNQRSTTDYNPVGNVNTVTDFNGKTTTYKYDVQNRLVEQDFSNDPTVTMTYTIDGQIATITDGRGLTSFSYDVQNRLISKTDADGSKISYTYDLAGNRTSVTTQVLAGNSNTTYYTFDERNRLDKVLSGGLVLTDYDYDARSNLVKTTLGNGVIETRQYDKLNHLLNLQTNKSNNILTNFVYTLDKVGNRQQVVETVGSNTRTVGYVYDDLYRLMKEQITDEVNGNRTTEFVYDKVGNRQQQQVTANNVVTATTYQYDANDRLLKEQVNSTDKVVYIYDNNGNTLTKTENGKTTESIWNDQNRLVGAKVKDGAGVVTQQVSYEYDASGIRVSQNVDGEITKYLIDANLPYAQAVVEYRPSGLVVVSYTHGHDLISQTRDGASSFYHVDGLGSTRGLSDAGGNLINTYSYQAFGELLNSSGGSENKYLFAGEQFDPVLGDYYNRARYYDPGTGNFISRDAFEGNLSTPSSLHKYQYGDRNPILNTDPSGYWTLTESIAAITLTNILATLFSPILQGAFLAGNTDPDGRVKVYFGYSPLYLTGHTAIEVNGRVYDYPGGAQDAERRAGRDPAEFFMDQRTRHQYYTYHKYAFNYNSQQVAQIALNTTSLLTPGGYFSDLNEDGNYPFGKHCVNFVKSSLVYSPNNDWRFSYAQWSAWGQLPMQYEQLVYALSIMSRGKTVSKLDNEFG